MGSLVSLNVDLPALPTSAFNVVLCTSVSDYELAAANLTTAKAMRKQIEEQRVAMKKPIDDAAKAVQAFFKPYIDALDRYDAEQKGEMLDFKRREESLAAEKQQAANAAAAAERARLEAEAATALEAGDVARAEVLANTAEVVQATTIATTVVASGVSTRKVWKAEVTDKAAFVAVAGTDQMFLAAVDINEQTLAKFANATNGAVKIPGVRLYQDEVMSARRAA
jgi:hypothetical protein